MFNPFILALLIISISWRLRAVESRMISMPQSPQPSTDADRFDNWRHLDINEPPPAALPPMLCARKSRASDTPI
jgi:hypothetical protein